jgi:hypothetical protein
MPPRALGVDCCWRSDIVIAPVRRGKHLLRAKKPDLAVRDPVSYCFGIAVQQQGTERAIA